MPLSPSELPHQLLGLPWQFLVLGLALCLIFSALGFRRVEYFVSLGYAASIAAQAVAFPFLYRDTIRGLALLQAGLLLAYGLRLGIFLALRGSRSLVPETAGGKHATQLQCWGPDQGCNLGRSIVLLRSPFLAGTAHDVSAGRRNGVGIGPRGDSADVGRPWPRGFRRLAEIRVQETKSVPLLRFGSLQRSALSELLWRNGVLARCLGFGHVDLSDLFRLGPR
jgi:hypothetical protein